MAATENVPLVEGIGKYTALPVAAATRIFEGAMVGRNAAGFAVAFTGGAEFLGHCSREADNREGANGDLDVQLLSGPYSLVVPISGVTVASVGRPVFATDDNTLTLTPGGTLVGKIVRFERTGYALVHFITATSDLETLDISGNGDVRTVEFDTATDTDTRILIPATANTSGLIVEQVYARVTEVFAGASEDQGIVTVEDSTAVAIQTLTPTNAGADAVDDIIQGYQLTAATTGAALKVVPAGRAVQARVTQATSGAGAAGKMVVYLRVRPLT